MPWGGLECSLKALHLSSCNKFDMRILYQWPVFAG